MKAIGIAAALLYMVSTTFCQQNKATQKIKFNSINQAGMVSGSNGESIIVQTINGISKDKWSAGIGAGLDFYVDRSVPLFLDVRTDLSDKKSMPFIYADAGANFPWLNFIQREQRNTFSTSAGFYSDLGAGWRFKIKNKSSILFSGGYTYKQGKGTGTRYDYNPITTIYEEGFEYRDFKYRRFTLKIGFQF